MESGQRPDVKSKSRRFPESKEYEGLKGKLVEVWRFAHPDDDSTLWGRLKWVDTYTLGIQVGDSGPTSIIYKHAISRVELAGNDREV